MVSVTDPVRLGQINQSGGTEALFLKKASGIVLASFISYNITVGRTFTKTAPPGEKSEQFPYVGQTSTRRRELGKNILQDYADDTAGTGQSTPSQFDLYGVPAGTGTIGLASNVNLGEREVFLDDPLETYHFVDNWEKFKSSFDIDPQLAREMGRSLAKDHDRLVMRLILKGCLPTARGGIDWSSSSIASEFQPASDGANMVTESNAATSGQDLLNAIRQVMEQFDTDEDFVPMEDRYVALAPAQYNLLVQNQDLLNRDFGGGNNGVYADGTVYRAWGAELIKTPRVPGSNYHDGSATWAALAGEKGPGYQVNASNVVAVIWQKRSVASLLARMASFEMSREPLYRGTALIGSMATGNDILMPLGCAAIVTA